MCCVAGCGGRHHSLLHKATAEEHSSKETAVVSPPATRSTPSPSPSEVNGTMNLARNSAFRTDLQQIALKVVPVKVSVPDSDRVIETYDFLVDGSDTSMCLKTLAEDLGAPPDPVDYVLSTFSGSKPKNGLELSLDAVCVSTGKGVRLEKVLTTEQLPISNNSLANKDLSRWPHL
jgi:hypothetical protein